MTVKKIVVILFVLAILGVGAAFAVGTPTPAPRADAVVVLNAQGVTCGSCGGKIERALKEKPGVAAVEVDVDNGRVAVAYDSAAVKSEALAGAVSALGYESKVAETYTAEEYRARTGRTVSAQNGGYGGCGGGCCNKNRKIN